MTVRNYDIETSELIVLQGDDGNNSYKDVWAIFDVSRTTECRFIAIHWDQSHPNEKRQEHEMLTVFDHVDELLLWCAYRQENGAEFRTGLDQNKFQNTEWLEKLSQDRGYESWENFCDEWMDHVGVNRVKKQAPS